MTRHFGDSSPEHPDTRTVGSGHPCVRPDRCAPPRRRQCDARKSFECDANVNADADADADANDVYFDGASDGGDGCASSVYAI